MKKKAQKAKKRAFGCGWAAAGARRSARLIDDPFNQSA